MPIKPPAPTIKIDGYRLRELRKLAGYNLTAFGLRADIHPSYVCHLELGRRANVSPEVYGRICNALDIADRRELLKVAA